MILIRCPHCGPRNSNEFSLRRRDEAPAAGERIDQAEWRRYLYEKRNPAGWTTEHMVPRCRLRKFLVAERHTVTNEVRWTGLPGEPIARGGAVVIGPETVGSCRGRRCAANGRTQR